MYTLLFGLLKIAPLWLLQLLARFVAFCLCIFKKNSLYRSTCINIMLVRPDAPEQERITWVKQSIYNQIFNTLASAKVWVMPTDWAKNNIAHVHNKHILHNALQAQKGILVVVPHIGSWEMMNAWMSDFASPVIMYKPFKNQAIDHIIKQGRQRLNATLIPTDNTGVKALLATLKSGGMSIVLPDHVPDKNGGIVAPFFNIPTLTGTLTPKLIQKTRCTVIGLTCIWKKNGFHIHCFALDDPNLYHKDNIIATSALNTAMENMIYTQFTQYMWGYRRFKHTPIADNLYLLDFDTIYQKRIEMQNE